MPEVLKTRPDLSFITSKKFNDLDDFYNYLDNAEPKEGFRVADANRKLPELIQIAEMYFDSMVGTPAENSLVFKIVSETLNSI